MAKRRRKPTPAGITLELSLQLGNGRTAPRCQYWNAKKERQCRQAAARGYDRCRFHGARQLNAIGPANPNWRGGVSTTVHGKPGRWTHVLGEPYRDSYIKALRDPDILSLEGEIGLIDVRLEELIKRCDQNADWGEAARLYDELVAAMNASDPARIRTSLLSLGDVVRGQRQTDRAWDETMEITERRRALV